MTTIADTVTPAEAIRFHYDISNQFYERWLGRDIIYSCAVFEANETPDDLSKAQDRKLDLLLGWANIAPGDHVLDVGCGWGGLLRRVVSHHHAARATGLSLSERQTEWILQKPDPRIDVRIESWMEHEPAHPYDAITSVEAIENFVKPGLTRAQRTAVYRALFDRCHAWLKPGGMLVIQINAYGNSGPEDLDGFISRDIFPDSDLPRLVELVDACDRRFEVCSVVNDRDQYLLTTRAWLNNLRKHREALVAMVGDQTVQRYEQYLKLCTYLFASGSCDLYRIALRRIDFPREAGRQRSHRH